MPAASLIRCIWRCLLAAPLATGAVCTATGTEPVGSVLILRNGNILEGIVRPVGEYYRIEQSGATLQVPASQVDCVCHSLNEAYEVRRQNRVGSSVDSNLELARWCLRHNMLDQAAREILDARTKDPRHPALKLLDLQLRQQMELVTAKAKVEQIKPDHAPLSVTPASAEAPAPPNAEPLDISTDAQAEFVRSIQPMLVYGCATGGCHQSGSRQQLQLDRWALEGSGNPTLIRRNLDSVLAQVNREDPPSSPLMRWARQSHGLAGARPSTPLASYQAGLMLDWLNHACGLEPEQTVPEQNQDGLHQPPASDPAGAPAEDELLGELTNSRGAEGALAGTTTQVANSPSYAPRDPFDAEVFNRRYAAEREATRRRRQEIQSAEVESVDSTAPREPTPEEAAVLTGAPTLE